MSYLLSRNPGGLRDGTKEHLHKRLCCVHTLPDSFCAGKKIIPDRISVHT